MTDRQLQLILLPIKEELNGICVSMKRKKDNNESLYPSCYDSVQDLELKVEEFMEILAGTCKPEL